MKENLTQGDWKERINAAKERLRKRMMRFRDEGGEDAEGRGK